MKRQIATMLVLCISASVLTGCKEKEVTGPESETTLHDSVQTTETSAVFISETTSATNEENTETTIVETKESTTEETSEETSQKPGDELFQKFSETVESNPGLSDYKDYVYLMFPVVSDAEAFIDEEYFYSRLSTLTIKPAHFEDGKNGEYDPSNVITFNADLKTNCPERIEGVLFHELMHFVDWNINGPWETTLILDDQHIRMSDFQTLSTEEMQKTELCPESWIITEGGAEYWTSKFLTGAPDAYTDCVSFLSGMEYILGEDYMKKLFYSWDTDAFFEELFLEIGYTPDQFVQASIALNCIARPDVFDMPDATISADDMLIELYTQHKGENWKEDAKFLAILKNLNGIGLQGWRRSKNADFLEGIVYQTWDQFEELEKKFTEGIPEDPNLVHPYPTLFMKNGKLLYGTYGSFTDTKSKETYMGYITYEWDFETDTRSNYTITHAEKLT
ncbi:MAG: hypothetical protein IKD90_02845 [Clostridiales bacterium]|nr:hypothetical protein [Clostridiales bacterium]